LNRLRHLRVKEGSLVDDPANPKAQVMIVKLKGGDNMDPIQKDTKKPKYVGLSDKVKSKFLSDMKKDPTKDITAAMRRLSEWAAQGHYPTGLNHSDLKWMYDEYANELHSRDKNSKAGGNFPSSPTNKSTSSMLSVEKCASLTNALSSVKSESVGKHRGFVSLLKNWMVGEGYDPNPNDKEAQTFIDSLQDDTYSDQVLAALTAALANTIDTIMDDPGATDRESLINQATKDYTDRLNAVGVVKAKGGLTKEQQDILSQLKGMMDKLMPGDGNTHTQKSKEGNNLDLNSLPEDVQKAFSELTKRAESAEAQIEELKKSANGGKQEPEDIFKGMSTEVKKRFEEMEKRAQEAEKIAKAEQETRLVREFVAKAKDYQGLPMEAEEMGKVFKTLSEKAPDEFGKVEELLKKADAAIAQGNLFREVGKTANGGDGGVYEKLTSIAKSKVEKNKDLSFNDAFNEAITENPSLYEQYRSEVNH